MNYRTRVFSSKNVNFLMFLYILSLYLFTYRDGLYHISNLLALILVSAIWIEFLLSKRELKRELVFTKTLKIFLVFIGVCSISIIYAIDKSTAIDKVQTMVLLFILIFSLANYINTYDKLKSLMRYFVYSGLIASIYLLLTADYSSLRFFGQELGNPNAIGIILAISATFTLYFILRDKQYYYSIFLLTLIPTIFLTGSRKSLFLICINALIILYLRYNKGTKNKLKFIGIVLLIAIISFYLVFNVTLFYNIVGQRIENVFSLISGEKVNEGSINLRIKMIKEGFKLFKNRPFLGYGADNFRVLFAQVPGGRETYSHNNYIELLVNTGVIGFGVYYLMQILVIVDLFKFRKKTDNKILSHVFLVFMISYLIMALALVYYYNKHFTILLIMSSLISQIPEMESEELG